VKGPFVQVESATRDVEDDEVLDVFVAETLLLLDGDVEVTLALLVEVALVDDEVVDFFVEDDVVVFLVEDVVVCLTARISTGPSSMARPFFPPITAADAARLKDTNDQRPNFEINILSTTEEDK
jgi:hypothetical protein